MTDSDVVSGYRMPDYVIGLIAKMTGDPVTWANLALTCSRFCSAAKHAGFWGPVTITTRRDATPPLWYKHIVLKRVIAPNIHVKNEIVDLIFNDSYVSESALDLFEWMQNRKLGNVKFIMQPSNWLSSLSMDEWKSIHGATEPDPRLGPHHIVNFLEIVCSYEACESQKDVIAHMLTLKTVKHLRIDISSQWKANTLANGSSNQFSDASQFLSWITEFLPQTQVRALEIAEIHGCRIRLNRFIEIFKNLKYSSIEFFRIEKFDGAFCPELWCKLLSNLSECANLKGISLSGILFDDTELMKYLSKMENLQFLELDFDMEWCFFKMEKCLGKLVACLPPNLRVLNIDPASEPRYQCECDGVREIVEKHKTLKMYTYCGATKRRDKSNKWKQVAYPPKSQTHFPWVSFWDCVV